MKRIILLIVLTILLETNCKLISRQVQTTYNIYGGFQAYEIAFKSTQDICSYCQIQVTFPELIHITASPLIYSITDQNKLTIITNSQSLTPTSMVYYFPTLQILAGDIWYTIKIFSQKSPTLIFGLVGVRIISGAVASSIAYQSNNAFGYYHIQTMSLPSNSFSITPITTAISNASVSYPFQINFQSSVISNVPITIQFLFTNQNYSLLNQSSPILQNNNFKFTGGCSTICNLVSCIQQTYCIITNNTIQLSLPYLDNQTYTLQFTVANPNFIDSTGLAGLVFGSSNIISSLDIINNVFSVSPINIIPSSVNLFWGIPLNTVQNDMGLGIFVGGGWNTIDIGFHLSDITMIGSQFKVIVYVGAFRVLQQSINTNLPSLSGTSKMRCVYNMPNIECNPVDAFTSISLRYFIKLKASFSSVDNIANLGSICIQFSDSNTNILFNNLTQNLPITQIPWTDYHDTSGFHSTAYNIKQTQIIGTSDTGLANSTSTFMNRLYTNNSFVGIDPEIANQQLVFLMKTLPSHMSLGVGVQNYEMRLFLNPNIFSNISQHGLDFSAYRTSTHSHSSDAVSCYINSSTSATIQIYQCQSYNDYVYGHQIDNSYTAAPYYSKFQFICGNGNVTVCPSGQSCAQSCRALKGQSNLDGYSGVFSIRGVTFKKGYQSPFQANEMSLDFIIAFYNGGSLVSASLLNAYTIKSSRLQYIAPKFYNTYLSTTKQNDGNRVPTLLSIDGHLSIQETNAIHYDQIAVFISGEATANKYIEPTGRVGCTYSCASSVTLTASALCLDNWVCKQKISIMGVANLDTSISIKIPIQITAAIYGSIDVGFLVNSTLIMVYRLNGSSIQQMMSPVNTALLSASIYSNAWNSANYWVKTPADTFNERLNLNAISSFSGFNTIDMMGSVLTYNGPPFLTFTSTYYSIFSSYSTATSNNILSCDSPFTYNYNLLYDVTVLFCPLLNNTLNQINISYPLYPNILGAGFPFQQMFAYGLSDIGGNLIAFRTESNSKIVKDICICSQVSIINYGQVTSQQFMSTLTINPITLSAAEYSSIHLIFTFPTSLPLIFLSCEIVQTLTNQIYTCTIISSTINQVTIQLSVTAMPAVITSLQIKILQVISGLVSVSSTLTYYYYVDVLLPQTDSLGNAAIYGVYYTPFNSVIQSCSNYMNLANLPSISQPIVLNNLQINGVTLNYYSDISFNVQFSQSRPNLLPTSKIIISFSNVITTSKSTCSIWKPQNYIYLQQIIAANSITLIPQTLTTSFTSTVYTVSCKDMLIQSNSFSLSMKWIDGVNILQQSNILPFTASFLAPSSLSGTIVSKMYNTLGYDSKYTISLNYASNLGDSVEIWIDFGKFPIHSAVLECYYLSNSLNVQIYCSQDWEGRIHLFISVVSSASLIFSIYGIEQDLTSIPQYQVLMGVNQLVYYKATIVDNLSPNIISSAQPIIINRQAISNNYCLQMEFSFPIAFSSLLYLQLNDYFELTVPQVIICSIDGVAQICSRAEPNIILISTTIPFLSNSIHALQIRQLLPANQNFYEQQFLQFRLFTVAGSSIVMGSHQHLSSPLLLATLPPFPTDLMQWYEQPFNSSWIYHKIYIGYYGQTVYICPISLSPFNETLFTNFTSASGLNYANTSTTLELGYFNQFIDIASLDFSAANSIDYLSFTHFSTSYSYPPYLPVFISNDKCLISSQFSLYQLYPGGITLPILLDFSNCRPALTHQLTYLLSNQNLVVDTSLTNQLINFTYPQVYIVIRQVPTNNLFSGLFNLQITLSGPFSNSFYPISSVSIKVNPGTILQIPQSTQPIINDLNNSFVNVTLQCNQPSTIYWALGFYPTILGITYQVIQAQLVTQLGVRKTSIDPYSWSQQVYGLDYEYYANKNKTIIFNSLRGSREYIFKYFCINQLGSPSGGKILYFNTSSSGFDLNKVILGFSSKLTIEEGNLIACYIAQVLKTPYSSVMTSTYSNCINSSTTFYKTSNTKYYDGNNGGLYYYYFYIDSLTIPSSYIRTSLSHLLNHYSNYVANIPPYSSFAISPLSNNYTPYVKKTYFYASVNNIVCTIDVGVPNSYLIAAYMNITFDPQTMTIPPHYLIKQGYFSGSTQFNQVFMMFGSNNISINITGLNEYYNYSIFYFVTVDNPALNSKPTQVYYQNVQTSIYAVYDLSERWSGVILLLMIYMIASI